MWRLLRRELTWHDWELWHAQIDRLEDAMERAEDEDPIDEWAGSCYGGFESYRDRPDFKYMYSIERAEQQD